MDVFVRCRIRHHVDTDHGGADGTLEGCGIGNVADILARGNLDIAQRVVDLRLVQRNPGIGLHPLLRRGHGQASKTCDRLDLHGVGQVGLRQRPKADAGGVAIGADTRQDGVAHVDPAGHLVGIAANVDLTADHVQVQ